MNSQVGKQILVGGLVGLLVFAIVFLLLGGKRDTLKTLQVANVALEAEVQKRQLLKSNYEALKKEVAVQEKIIEELIKVMPTTAEKGEMPYRIKKVADGAGIDQLSFTVESPIQKDYCTEYPFTFQFRAGFHSFGQFASLLSGYEKIVNMGNIQFKRLPAKGLYPATVTCRISAFVYNPAPVASPAAGAAKPKAVKAKED